MAQTLEDLLKDQNSILERSYDTPTDDELTYRVSVINQSIRKWGNTARWKQLKEELKPSVTSANASISLGENHREFLQAPQVQIGTSNWREYQEIQIEEKYAKDESDYYCYVGGNPASGYFAQFNNLASGASLSITHLIYPSGLATLTDRCEVPDPEFVLFDSTATILGPSSPRFTEMRTLANESLRNMLNRNVILTPGGVNQVRKTGKAIYKIGTPKGV